MKTNWLKLTNKINSERFQIPAGWETKEQVAESLQCSPDKVPDLLKPGLQTGDIERAEFPIWDEKRRMAVKVTCYREAVSEALPEPLQYKPKGKPGRKTFGTLEERILAKIKENPHDSDAKIAKRFHRYNLKAADIAAVRKTYGSRI